jgi:hypothetical protein
MVFHKMMLISLLLFVMSLSASEILPFYWRKTRAVLNKLIPISIISSILFFFLYCLEL